MDAYWTAIHTTDNGDHQTALNIIRLDNLLFDMLNEWGNVHNMPMMEWIIYHTLKRKLAEIEYR